ncbi:YdbH domain-containing protein [uncultured Algimonas sp.]|uniref:intermembrane phospholipid transport protein YdbH family protein n=1 Tax=uncultured Algimonas sp. TaxID=1547920 RepID=UPI00261282C8|nr:YdbH domain-containing protein [uncultured Algimonas sp.]
MSARLHATSERSAANSRTLRPALKIAIGIGAFLLLALILAAGWIWSNRFDLMERQAVTYLDSLGIDADLDIRAADEDNADIRNIRLSHDGETFLSIDRLQAAYQWRDLLDGRVERLDFEGLDATITMDENGRIIDGWRPPSTGGDTPFPARGVGLDEATLRLRTPFGEATTDVSGEIESAQQFALEGDLKPTTLSRDGASIIVRGPFTLNRDDDSFTATAPRTRLSLSHPSGTLRDTLADVNGRFDIEDRSAQGRLVLRGGTFGTAAELTGGIDLLSFDGRWRDGRLLGDADAVLSDVALTDEEQRRDLSGTLSLASALTDVPVAQNFAPGLVAPINDLLTQADVEARLTLDISDTDRTISLRGPMTMQASRTTLTVGPAPDTPLYRYETGAALYDVAASITMDRPLPIQLDPLRIGIRSPDGFTVEAVASATGRLETGAVWRAATGTGRPARLAPLVVAFDYAASPDVPSRLELLGVADYDGDIPGGYATGLVTGGRLTAQFEDGRNWVAFAPDRPLRFDRLETTSEWIVEDFEGRLDPGDPVYARDASGAATVSTRLADATLKALRPETEAADAAELDLQIGQADLAGRLRDDRQNWTVAFDALALQSDSFPVEGTDLELPEGELTVALSADARSSFALVTPDSILRTPAYVVEGMALDASGTAERYTLAYEGGDVTMIPETEEAMTVPVLPVSGTLLFEDGRFSGNAETILPRAPGNPVNVDYRFVDGRGTADVSIRDLRFQPGGLQPQDLAPALRGKIAQVDGAIDADLDIAFGGDAPMSGTGTVDIKDISLGTAPGPVTGLSGQVELTSLFPVVTAPEQRLSVATFNPGFPLEDGTLVYALVEDGVDITSAVFPLGEGQVSFDPFLWTYGAPENRVVLRVSGVEVGEFLKDVGNGRLSVSGILEGAIPVVVRGIEVLVENGRLEVKNGGVIRYKGEDVSGSIPNEYAGKAIQALENFSYESLFLEIDGPLDGEILMGLLFTGSNPDVLYDVPFQFNVTVEGELFNIARSLNPNGMQERILTIVAERAEPGADEPEGPEP